MWETIGLIIGIIAGIITIIVGIIGIYRFFSKGSNWKKILIKHRIIWLLKKYEKNKYHSQKEKKLVIKFGQLLEIGKEKLSKLGFAYDENNIKDDNFQIHLTRTGNSPFISQFLIRHLENRHSKNPDEVYFSENYPIDTKEKSKKIVLYEFIQYLKNKK